MSKANFRMGFIHFVMCALISEGYTQGQDRHQRACCSHILSNIKMVAVQTALIHDF